MNDIIVDTDSDIGRIRLGREICRARKPIYIHIDEQRMLFKEKFRNGDYTPWQFLQSMSKTIGCKKFT